MGISRQYSFLLLLALGWGTLLAVTIRQPGYTDAYYYFNAGQRLVDGQGLTDAYLWTYINAPDALPGPSHTYWMPLQSLVTAGSMAVFGGHFGAAQLPPVVCLAGLVMAAFWFGGRVGGTRRHAWVSGLLVLFSGFYTPFWTTTDTFALYGLVGALALLTMGLGRKSGRWQWYMASGLCAGLAHLTRADGVLLLAVIVLVAWWPGDRWTWRVAFRGTVLGVIAYLLVMSPWFARNWHEIGTPLPTGGTDTVWMRSYDQLANYPPGAESSAFWAWGLANIVRSRADALLNNLGTFVAVETWVVLGPFALGGMWMCRRDPMFRGPILYAIGLHLLMTFVFAFPGYRGGLFHSSAALLPFWATAGVIGLDAGIRWMARRRHWHQAQAQTVFNTALVVLAIALSVGILVVRLPGWNRSGLFYAALADDLPSDAVVMTNDPAALYYHTGLNGVVVPNADPEVVVEIAEVYGVTHLLLDVNRTAPFSGLFFGDETYPFLRLIAVYGDDTDETADDRRLYAIVTQERVQ